MDMMWPIIVSAGASPSRKKLPTTSSTLLLSTGKRANSYVSQRCEICKGGTGKVVRCHHTIQKMVSGACLQIPFSRSSTESLSTRLRSTAKRASPHVPQRYEISQGEVGSGKW